MTEEILRYQSPRPFAAHAFEDKVYGYFWYEIVLEPFYIAETAFFIGSAKIGISPRISSFVTFSNGVEFGGRPSLGIAAQYQDADGNELHTFRSWKKVPDPGFSSGGAREVHDVEHEPIDGDVGKKISQVDVKWYVNSDIHPANPPKSSAMTIVKIPF